MIWRDVYDTLRRKYDGARGQIEQEAEKLRQLVRMAINSQCKLGLFGKVLYLHVTPIENCLVF
uniref:Uncharacterized protein n=1 Tax=Cucumis melo TaxID=3656 RepID=A0A9I9EJD8_CUCME